MYLGGMDAKVSNGVRFVITNVTMKIFYLPVDMIDMRFQAVGKSKCFVTLITRVPLCLVFRHTTHGMPFQLLDLLLTDRTFLEGEEMPFSVFCQSSFFCTSVFAEITLVAMFTMYSAQVIF